MESSHGQQRSRRSSGIMRRQQQGSRAQQQSCCHRTKFALSDNAKGACVRALHGAHVARLGLMTAWPFL
jgi:hypothetical protein